MFGLFSSCTTRKASTSTSEPSSSRRAVNPVKEGPENFEADATGTTNTRVGSINTVLNADASGEVAGCIFCGVSKERGFDVVWEDDKFVVFRDHNPASAHHLLVIPKRHIDSVRTLSREDASMVARMAEIGHSILDELQVSPSARRLGFHIPPFYSVKHLHMHVQAYPYRSWLRHAKYPVASGSGAYDKGFSWFVEAEQAVRILEKGRPVKMASC